MFTPQAADDAAHPSAARSGDDAEPQNHQQLGRPVLPGRGRLRPLGLAEVQIGGGFWGDRQRINAEASLAHIEGWLEREGWLGNFDLVRDGGPASARRGREFSDSEVYKLLEAMAWELGRRGGGGDHGRHGDLEARFDAIVERVAAAQQPDGYLSTAFGRPGQPARYSDLEWGHELYCYGHLIQAAVARARTRPEPSDLLVSVARRVADHVCETFGPDGIASVCGHPEIEPALIELYRVTGERRYLEQARLFLERRGHHVLSDVEYGRSYFQDDVPIRAATVLRGHAVRATYLASGAVDLAAETDDDELLAAVTRQWRTTVARRTYLTGGMGSRHQDEAFGEDFMLPPDRAYSETCAGVGSVMLSWRLLLAHGGPEYADLIERTLFNVVATSPAADGRAFYYTNTLHQRELGTVPDADRAVGRAASSLRAPWFTVSCCPTNVARTLASLDGYVATTDDDGLQLHQYVPARIRTRLPDGRAVEVDVVTDYPRSGRVVVRVMTGDERPWTLSLRVPSWAAGASLAEGGERRPVEPGTATVTRVFRAGDEVVLDLPVVPRFTRPDPRIDAVRGCVAVERGPEVLCVESVDVPTVGSVDELRLDPTVAPVERDGRVLVHASTVRPADRPWPYVPVDLDDDGNGVGRAPGGAATDETEASGVVGPGPGDPAQETFEVPMLPYHDWANRGPSTMRVWIPTT